MRQLLLDNWTPDELGRVGLIAVSSLEECVLCGGFSIHAGGFMMIDQICAHSQGYKYQDKAGNLGMIVHIYGQNTDGLWIISMRFESSFGW